MPIPRTEILVLGDGDLDGDDGPQGDILVRGNGEVVIVGSTVLEVNPIEVHDDYPPYFSVNVMCWTVCLDREGTIGDELVLREKSTL